uniref:Uncharacterized protein n=1 Tax=Oryza brachyantha TaxID=4533 RepID=J3MRI0_ORYBR
MQPRHRPCVAAIMHSTAATIPFIAGSCNDTTTIHSVIAKIHSLTANIHSTSRGRISKQTWRRGAGGREGQAAGSRKSLAGKLPSPIIRSGRRACKVPSLVMQTLSSAEKYYMIF